MAFQNWKGDFNLRIAGKASPARLQRNSQGPSLLRHLSAWTPERVRSLNYPGRPDSFALVLKNNGLIIPEAHEIGAVAVTSPEAVKAFVARWDYKALPIAEALRLFAYRGFPARFDCQLLIRNLIFRVWLWTQRGIIRKIDNVVREGWYMYVKPVLAQYRILQAPDYDRYFAELRYLTRIRELGITYRDFGFIDHERGIFWDIGKKRPEILLYAEKEALKGVFDEVNAELSASYILNHGQPNRYQVETLGLEIGETAPGKTVHMVSVVDFNPGGFAIEGAGVEGLTYHGVPVQTHRVLELRALSEDQIEEFRAPLAEAIRKPGGQLEMTFGSEASFSQCEKWFATAVQHPRFREEVATPEGVRITYYGFDLDILGMDWIRSRLKRILARILEQAPSGRTVGPGAKALETWLDGYRRSHGMRAPSSERAKQKMVRAARELLEARGPRDVDTADGSPDTADSQSPRKGTSGPRRPILPRRRRP